MPQPFNYMLDLPDPTNELLKTAQLAGALNSIEQQRAEAQQQAQRKAAMQEDFANLSEDFTPESLSKLMIKYPEMSENLNRGYQVLSEEQRNAKIGRTSQIYSALKSGRTDLAKKLLLENAEAARNSGQEGQAMIDEDLAQFAELDPKGAAIMAGASLSALMGPDKYAETFGKLQSEARESELQPSALTKAEADAERAAIKSKFAESKEISELEKNNWDIKKIQNDIDISKQNKKLAVANAALDRETDELKRKKLKAEIAAMEEKRETEIREKAADLQDARLVIDNSLATIDDALAFDDDVFNNVLGFFDTIFPSDGDEAKLQGLIKTIKSQAFLSSVKSSKPPGGLSEKEGDKLEAAAANLDTDMETKDFKASLKGLQEFLANKRKVLSTRYGVPETIPDTPNVQVSDQEAAELEAQYLNPPE